MVQIFGTKDNDRLAGTAGGDAIYGEAGDDRLSGLAGIDLLMGGLGNDWLLGGAGNDELYGDEGDDRLSGGVGDDLLVGGAGADIILGGDGADTLSYLTYHPAAGDPAGRGVEVDLELGLGFTGDAEGDVISGIEVLEGSVYGDVLLGSAGADRIFGGGGSDLIHGRGGDDAIGFDSSSFGGGSPTAETRIFGDEGNDRIFGYDGVGLVSGGAGDDTLFYGLVIDGGEGDDTITASYGGSSQIFGGSGDDTIYDGYRFDAIDAGDGNDIVVFDGLHGDYRDEDTVLLGAGDDILSMTTEAVDSDHDRIIDAGSGHDQLWINIQGSYNTNGGFANLNFREMVGGGELDLNGYRVSGFESVWMNGVDNARNVHFRSFDDAFWGGNMTGGTDRVSTVYGYGGDDYLDSGTGGQFRLLGGRGDDRIVADGGTTENFHRAFGNFGDDMIFGFYKSADYNSKARLAGGPGADGFIFVDADHMDSADADVITDFDPSEDWIGLSFGHYSEVDAMTTERTELTKTLLEDSDTFLRFETKARDGWGALQNYIVRYNKVNGVVTVSNDGRDMDKIVKVRHAPELELEHFYGLTLVSGSDAAALDENAPRSADLALTDWDIL